MAIKIPEFKKKSEKFAFLKKNEKAIIKQKKSKVKRAKLNLNLPVLKVKEKKRSKKSATTKQAEPGVLDAEVVISTTNIRDSHKDVHFDGWAKESIKSTSIMHLQEHNSTKFNMIISDGDDLNVKTKEMTWQELGFNFEGKTEALIFESKIRKERNPEMFKNYSKGWVKNHSVGMVYEKVFLAIDSEEEDYKENKKKFDKYIDRIANKEEVVKDGYFWGVLKAQVIEGSSVPAGSNYATPTLSTSIPKSKKKKKKSKKSDFERALKRFKK